MANVLIESQTMTDIADAIREKNGTDTTYKPAEMPQAVRDIKSDDTGVGSRQWWLDVCKYKTNYSYMFQDCVNLTTIPQLDTSKGTDFSYMFYHCYNLTTIPLLDTSKSENFSNMFRGCNSLTTIPQLDTSKVTNYSYTFRDCINLTTIPPLDTSKGTNFLHMFFGCNSLTTIPQLDTSKVTSFTYTFAGCINLKNISFVANCIKNSISFESSPLLSNESLQSIIDGLADLTGQTAKTLALHTDVKSKLTEEQIAMITSKNWTLA